MTIITATLEPTSGNKQFTYNSGDVKIAVTLGKGMKLRDEYSFALYNEKLMLMGNADTGKEDVVRQKRTINMTFSNKLWIPGNYFFLMRVSEDRILRFDMMLDENCTFSIGDAKICGIMSDEDVLSGYLCKEHRIERWKRLSCRPGFGQLKKWLIERAKWNEWNKKRDPVVYEKLNFCSNMLLSAQSTSALAMSSVLLKKLAGIDGELHTVNCNTFYDNTNSNPYEKLNDFLRESPETGDYVHSLMQSLKSKVYLFRGVGALTGNGGKTIMKKIMYHCFSGDNSVFFCGTKQEIETILEDNPSLEEYFPEYNRLTEEPYSIEEFLLTLFSVLSICKIHLSPESTDVMCKLMREAYQNGSVNSWLYHDMWIFVEKQLMYAHCRNSIEAVYEGNDYQETFNLTVKDVNDCVLPLLTRDKNSMLDELNEMVGLEEIKQNISTLSNRLRFYNERRRYGLNTRDCATYHAIFTGNPGTGKTTVARLLGQIYHSVGILSKGDVICLDRTKVIGRYIGETEDNMKQILKDARGNVLFVDEAYTLYTEGDEKDFGRHAVECLMDILSRNNPDMVVIFAGYDKEMETLMSLNPGLKGRFPYKFHFNDYNADELMQIAEKILSKDDYYLTEEAAKWLRNSIDETLANRNKDFGNARWIGQYIHNGIIPALADRIESTEHPYERASYQKIELTDVQTAFERLSPKTLDKKQCKVIGFSR